MEVIDIKKVFDYNSSIGIYLHPVNCFCKSLTTVDTLGEDIESMSSSRFLNFISVEIYGLFFSGLEILLGSFSHLFWLALALRLNSDL